MITTTFALIVFTTVVFGSFMALVGRIFVPPDKKKQTEEQLLEGQHEETAEHHEEIKHPNEESDHEEPLEKVAYYRWVDSGLVNWYGRFHESTLKPFFIRDTSAPTKDKSLEMKGDKPKTTDNDYVAPKNE